MVQLENVFISYCEQKIKYVHECGTMGSRVLRHRKKRPRVDFFAKANSSGLTNLPNQEHFYI